MFTKRLRNKIIQERLVTAQEAASWIQDGMTLGLSGFTQAGDAKAVPRALVERVKETGEKLKVNVYTGASLGSEVDGIMAEAGIINRRLPFQAEKRMRGKINNAEITYVDQHLSHTAEMVRAGTIGAIDVAIVEAVAIMEDGSIIPTTSVGNSSIFVEHAKEVIVELNIAQPLSLEGIHDIYDVGPQTERQPIPLTAVEQHIGTQAIKVPLEKIKGVVVTEEQDTSSSIVQPDEETATMASHLIEFLRGEVKAGRLPNTLAPLQSGIGSVANAVFHGFLASEFTDLEVYSEVLQDAVFDLLDAGKIRFASGCSIILSQKKGEQVFPNFESYKDRLVLRPQEISNHPEIIRRLGLIAINTALEVDIYGNVNSTHVMGTHMMNGIGGSGDFARNARLGIFVTKSIAKNGNISSVVPFISHVDHTEHDVDVIVTEQGIADLRGLSPRERACAIIENCAHPDYRPQLRAYFEEACTRGGQTPHVMEKAFSWHIRYQQEGTMLERAATIQKKENAATEREAAHV
ncbi:acetyl-CoA hydrolase/transferase family protein [Aneurinibacillus aneurinilyticus]|uniref:Succinate CoA transferase n=1 Tax=Aneurinibacillus aneurinilyticus ATCC 12856 TaxID=649747 RepID=U1YB66_ANEAE|nr:acetyl-CoA hydrolase/transferase family protein [Aneurinibacillus aneurinilyticus]ERI09347.1 succinate CoA transferase [Aneurinibacillus aneurinilyticus ATCC 12856]MED0672182.1 acetyl-CoA hydrolase/transferase family protein [Aneurinibacillus aneurinilyticus]MED0704709.1 acetyl-CoA hydrolase/transferase family protein [Aneurinibacillus aneurinilyticus]MED0723973.1 acetyl-CoA hydrolase/transferase family protein [Aneurinibacillus aneurinilyticus]MED0731982.1 acetyl-CoA hydrolase/transferase 